MVSPQYSPHPLWVEADRRGQKARSRQGSAFQQQHQEADQLLAGSLSTWTAGRARYQATYLSASCRQLLRTFQSRASFERCFFSHRRSLSLTCAPANSSSHASKLRLSVASSCSSAASRLESGNADRRPALLASATTNPKRFCRSWSLACCTSHSGSISQYLSTSQGSASKSRASNR